MFGLIIVIVGLAVFAVFMAAGTNYIDGDKIQSSEIKASVKSGITQYASGIVQFNLLFKRNPSNLSNISPSLIDPPKLPLGISAIDVREYDVPSVGVRLGTCYLANNVDYPTYLALSVLQSEFSTGQLRIVNNCSSLSEIAAPLTYPTSFNFIYLIKT